MNNPAPLLSFAIPTYNFGRFIAETILSIQNGLRVLQPENIEIVILDGGSNDNTEQVIDELAKIYPNIRYKKNPQRGGIDQDLDEVAQLTTGRYTWLFSADDLLVPGWDLYVQIALAQDPDIVLTPAILCWRNMNPIRPHPIFKFQPNGEIIDVSVNESKNKLSVYLQRANSLEAFFSFMSAIIVKAEVWRNLPPRPDYFGTCWAHCARLMPALFNQSRIKYINNFLILKRGENDSFMEHGLVHRIGIAVSGWSRLIEEFFPTPDAKKDLHKLLRNDITLTLFLYAKLLPTTPAQRSRLKALARQQFYENSATPGSVLAYVLFVAFPAHPYIFRLLSPLLPRLIRLRHQWRSFFS